MPGPVLRRKAHPATVDPPEDVENPGRRQSPVRPGGRDPTSLTGAIFRRVVAWLKEEDGESDDGDGPAWVVVRILKDVVIGISLGLLIIAAMIFLDGRGIIHHESAHNIRQMASGLASDPATIASIEESAGIKFLTPAKHGAMEEDLKVLNAKRVELAAKVRQMEEAEAKNKELTDAKVPEEHKALATQMELGRYCDGCPWKDGKTCSDRVDATAKADGAGRVASKLRIMGEEAVLWERKEKGACSFPPGCRWDCYAENHDDLKKAFGDDKEKLLWHWIVHGTSPKEISWRDCKCKGS